MCSFAFALAYIKCFRTYSVYLSFRHGVFILYTPCHRCPLAVLRSCFGYSLSHLRTAAACLSRCIRHRRRSKAKPLRGRRGRSRAVHKIAKVRTAVKPAVNGLSSSVTVRRSTAPCHLPQGGRLCAPSASLSTAEPRFAPYIPRRSPKQATKNPAEPGFCFNIRCGYSFSPDRPRRFRGSGCSYPCLFRTWFLPPYRS